VDQRRAEGAVDSTSKVEAVISHRINFAARERRIFFEHASAR
jgi:hypothetical protein